MGVPRALYTDFPLGLSLGKPADQAFQTQVIRSAFELLKETKGPIIRDFPISISATDSEPLQCALPARLNPDLHPAVDEATDDDDDDAAPVPAPPVPAPRVPPAPAEAELPPASAETEPPPAPDESTLPLAPAAPAPLETPVGDSKMCGTASAPALDKAAAAPAPRHGSHRVARVRTRGAQGGRREGGGGWGGTSWVGKWNAGRLADTARIPDMCVLSSG